MPNARNRTEVLTWRLVADLFQLDPGNFTLHETPSANGEADCLTLRGNCPDGTSQVEICRRGSVTVRGPNGNCRYTEWEKEMLHHPAAFVDELRNYLALEDADGSSHLTPEACSLKFIESFLAQGLSESEAWTCRTARIHAGTQLDLAADPNFRLFPTLVDDEPLGIDSKAEPGDLYWFVFRETNPTLCVNLRGRAYTRNGAILDLVRLHAEEAAVA